MQTAQELVASMNDDKAPMQGPPGLELRKTLVQQTATAAGEVWAGWWRTQLESQGRAATGGWPGTLSEARARVFDSVLPEMQKCGVHELSFDERELAAKTLYATARRRWLSHRER